MRMELLLLKQMYSSKRKLAIRDEEKRIYNVLLVSYIKACVLNKTENFTLFFDGEYIETRKERVKDWFSYFIDKCFEIFYKTFKPNDDRTFRKYELIHYGASKPVHVKVTNCPNEFFLEQILTRHGFKIIDEHLYSVSTVYEIRKLEAICKLNC